MKNYKVKIRTEKDTSRFPFISYIDTQVRENILKYKQQIMGNYVIFYLQYLNDSFKIDLTNYPNDGLHPITKEEYDAIPS